ncbi:ATP-binding SpoIIE family protein phosphatase [Saccharopolyspora sp. NPDC000995]
MRSTALAIAEEAHVARARQLATHAAQVAQLPQRSVDRVAVVASELASNLRKHASDGLFSAVPQPGRLDLVACDRGPGIDRVADSLRDGHSTAGTLGTGLGAARRLADEFDIFSREGVGTVVLARWGTTDGWPGALRIGAAQYTCPGEVVTGDGWCVTAASDRVVVVVSDGLGHGPAAAAATAAAVDFASTHPELKPAALLAELCGELAPTRGATVAVAEMNLARGALRFCGIGNVTARLHSEPAGTSEQLPSLPGIVGHRSPRLRPGREYERPWTGAERLILHTDGVTQRWTPEDRPDVFGHDPSVVAGWLLGQHCRRRDDACVVVLGGSRA